MSNEPILLPDDYPEQSVSSAPIELPDDYPVFSAPAVKPFVPLPPVAPPVTRKASFSDLEFYEAYEKANPKPSGKITLPPILEGKLEGNVLTNAASLIESTYNTIKHEKYKADEAKALARYHQMYAPPGQKPPIQALQVFNKSVEALSKSKKGLGDQLSVDERQHLLNSIVAWTAIIDSGRTDVYLPRDFIVRYAKLDPKGAESLKKTNLELAYSTAQNRSEEFKVSSAHALSGLSIPDIMEEQKFQKLDATLNKAVGYIKSYGLTPEKKPDILTELTPWQKGQMPVPTGYNSWSPEQKKRWQNAIKDQENAAATRAISKKDEKSATTGISITAAGISQIPFIGESLINPEDLQVDPKVYASASLTAQLPQFMWGGEAAAKLASKILIPEKILEKSYIAKKIANTATTAEGVLGSLKPGMREALSTIMVNTAIPLEGAIGRAVAGEKIDPEELKREIIHMNVVGGLSHAITGKLTPLMDNVASKVGREVAKGATGATMGVLTNMALQMSPELFTYENALFGVLGAIGAVQGDRTKIRVKRQSAESTAKAIRYLEISKRGIEERIKELQEDPTKAQEGETIEQLQQAYESFDKQLAVSKETFAKFDKKIQDEIINTDPNLGYFVTENKEAFVEQIEQKKKERMGKAYQWEEKYKQEVGEYEPFIPLTKEGEIVRQQESGEWSRNLTVELNGNKGSAEHDIIVRAIEGKRITPMIKVMALKYPDIMEKYFPEGIPLKNAEVVPSSPVMESAMQNIYNHFPMSDVYKTGKGFVVVHEDGTGLKVEWNAKNKNWDIRDHNDNPVNGLNANMIKAAMPTATSVVQLEDGSFDVEIGGRKFRFKNPDKIDNADLQEGYYANGMFDIVDADGKKILGIDGVISIARGTAEKPFNIGTGRTVYHEVAHAAFKMGAITEKEYTALVRKYGNEENIAIAYENWNDKPVPNTIFGKIKRFFQNIVNKILTPNNAAAERIFSQMRSGEVWNRKPQELDVAGIEKKNLKEKAAKTTPSSKKFSTKSENSLGQPIHPTEEGIKNFSKWFGDSKVVDEQGRPVVVYHGTPKNFTVFDNKKSSSTDRAASRFLGFFFTDNKADANRYAKWNGANGKTMELYLSVKNPYKMTYSEHDALNMYTFNKMKESNFKYTEEDKKRWDKEEKANVLKIKKDLINEGYDGITIVDRRGNVLEYITFNDTQIKSATGNTGDFSGKNSDTRYSTKSEKGLNESEEQKVSREGATRFSIVPPDEAKKLDKEETITVYRSMQLKDGKLYPPMSARVANNPDNKKEWRTAEPEGVWMRSEENPELIAIDGPNKGKFPLDKGNGTSVQWVDYNPYFHTSTSPLNDQFTSAANRSELVTVKVLIPKSELTSGYRADKAVQTVGELAWKKGTVSTALAKSGGQDRKVILSRYTKIIGIVKDSEVAQHIAEMLNGKGISIPANRVTPSLRAELEKLGVPIRDADAKLKPVKKAKFSTATEHKYDEVMNKVLPDWNTAKARIIVDDITGEVTETNGLPPYVAITTDGKQMVAMDRPIDYSTAFGKKDYLFYKLDHDKKTVKFLPVDMRNGHAFFDGKQLLSVAKEGNEQVTEFLKEGYKKNLMPVPMPTTLDSNGKPVPPPPPEEVLMSTSMGNRKQAAPTYGPGVPNDEVYTLNDIIDTLNSIGLKSRKGGFRAGKGVLGIFKPFTDVIRIKTPGDIQTMIHENGHFFHSVVIGMSGRNLKPIPPAFAPELEPLAYAGAKDKMTEGFAEWMVDYIYDPAKALADAPTFYKYFESLLGKNAELSKGIQLLRKQVLSFKNQSALQQVMSTIVTDPQKPKSDSVLTGENKVIRALFDDEIVLQQMVQMYENQTGTKLPATSNPKVLSALAKVSGVPSAWISKGVTDNMNKIISEPLQDIVKGLSPEEMKEFSSYLIAKESIDYINEKGNDEVVPLPKETYEAVVKQTEAKYKALADRIYRYQEHLLNFRVEQGLISAEDAKAWRQKRPHYVPLYRDVEMETGGKQKGGEISKKSYERKGSLLPMHDPIMSIIRDTYLYHSIAARNEMITTTVDLARRIRGGGVFADPIPAPMKMQTLTIEDIVSAAEGQSIGSLVDIQKDRTLFIPGGSYNGKSNVVRIYRDGKAEFYEVAPDIFRMLTVTEPNTWKALKQMTIFLRTGAVDNPDFMSANLVRDMQAIMINRTVKITPKDMINAWKYIATGKAPDSVWQQFNITVGYGASLVGADRVRVKEAVDKMRPPQNMRERFMKTWMKGFNSYKDFIAMTDLYAKFTHYGSQVKWADAKTRDELVQAVYDAIDQMPFQQKGEWIKRTGANKFWAFLNSNLQGNYRDYRTFRNPETRNMAIMRGILGLTLPATILYFRNKDDEDYNRLPDYIRDKIFWIRTPKGVVMVPLPYMYGLLFKAIPERILRTAVEKDPKAWRHIEQSILAQSPATPFPITAISPEMQIYWNRTFAGTPLIPESEKRLPGYMQYGANTSKGAIVIGKLIAMAEKQTGISNSVTQLMQSPRVIEALFKGHAGQIGGYALDVIGWVGKGKLLPPQPSIDLQEKIPGISRWVPKEGMISQQQNDVYEDIKKYERRISEMKKGSSLAENFNPMEYLHYAELSGKLTAITSTTKAEKMVRQFDSEDVQELMRNKPIGFELDDPNTNIHDAKRKLLLFLNKDKNEILDQRVLDDSLIQLTLENYEKERKIKLTPEEYNTIVKKYKKGVYK